MTTLLSTEYAKGYSEAIHRFKVATIGAVLKAPVAAPGTAPPAAAPIGKAPGPAAPVAPQAAKNSVL